MQKQFANVDLGNTVPHTRDPLHACSFGFQLFLVRYIYPFLCHNLSCDNVAKSIILILKKFWSPDSCLFTENLNSYILVALDIKISDIQITFSVFTVIVLFWIWIIFQWKDEFGIYFFCYSLKYSPVSMNTSQSETQRG